MPSSTRSPTSNPLHLYTLNGPEPYTETNTQRQTHRDTETNTQRQTHRDNTQRQTHRGKHSETNTHKPPIPVFPQFKRLHQAQLKGAIRLRDVLPPQSCGPATAPPRAPQHVPLATLAGPSPDEGPASGDHVVSKTLDAFRVKAKGRSLKDACEAEAPRTTKHYNNPGGPPRPHPPLPLSPPKTSAEGLVLTRLASGRISFTHFLHRSCFSMVGSISVSSYRNKDESEPSSKIIGKTALTLTSSAALRKGYALGNGSHRNGSRGAAVSGIQPMAFLERGGHGTAANTAARNGTRNCTELL